MRAVGGRRSKRVTNKSEIVRTRSTTDIYAAWLQSTDQEGVKGFLETCQKSLFYET